MIRMTMLLAAVLAAAPAVAQDKKPDRPMTDTNVTAKDVATTPLDDLNVSKKEIPHVLQIAQQDPYSTQGLRSCPAIAAQVTALNAVLGDDYDTAQRKSAKVSPGALGKAVVGAFIPFEGIIREVSGARAHQAGVQAAVVAGAVRRAFLKGVGQTRGCRYPARTAN